MCLFEYSKKHIDYTTTHLCRDMNRLIIRDYKFDKRITKMAESLGTSVIEDCDEYRLNFHNHIGEGNIRGINFSHGVGVMMVDGTFRQNLTLDYRLGRRHPIQFVYINDGDVLLETHDGEVAHDVSENESIIYAPQGDYNYSMTFRSGHRVQCIVVSVVRYLFLGKIECDINTIPPPLKEMFADTVGKKSFYFKSTNEPITVSTLTQIFKSDQTGLERKLLIESKSIKLITDLIKRFRVESDGQSGSYRLNTHDIKLINQAKNYIIRNIADTPTIKSISQEVGLNVNKLQRGFSALFGKSIRQFIITLKMHLALDLLDQGEKTISEVAYAVGYTNKGHFSQLFEKEFGLLPSQYTQRRLMANR